jgi:transcriptional regulator with XRE-family HTH domain
MDVRKQFGARVNKLRRSRGLSQEDLADLSGLHPTYISGIERGTRNVSLKNIRRLAVGLRVRMADLFANFEK